MHALAVGTERAVRTIKPLPILAHLRFPVPWWHHLGGNKGGRKELFTAASKLEIPGVGEGSWTPPRDQTGNIGAVFRVAADIAPYWGLPGWHRVCQRENRSLCASQVLPLQDSGDPNANQVEVGGNPCSPRSHI